MTRRPATGLLALIATGCLFLALVLDAGSVAAQPLDEEVPPGNPVVGSEAPGDSDVDETNYGLLGLIAVGLIGGGILLVTVERWERRRTDHAGSTV